MSSTLPEAWISLISQEEAQVKGSVDHPYFFGRVAAMGRLIMTHERIGSALQALSAQVMFEPGFLDRAEREMVATVASAAQDCGY